MLSAQATLIPVPKLADVMDSALRVERYHHSTQPNLTDPRKRGKICELQGRRRKILTSNEDYCENADGCLKG